MNADCRPAIVGAATHAAGRLLEVQHVWKAYTAEQFVVRDVSFTLEPGEFLTLLGPSGSGKTSTLMMVAGFETPTHGEIRVDGKDVAALPPERRNFGVVFQGYALFPHMTALENVEFALRMRRVGRLERRRRALEMLERVGLSGHASRRPRELSGGQQQRVALARALIFEPDALLLDEPLGALDRKLREQLQTEIKDIQRRVGISILFITHDQDEAMMMSDRIAVMAGGQIAQIGTPADVYRYPETQFVADFLGETNLLPVTVQGTDADGAVVRLADGTQMRTRLPRQGPAPSGSALIAVRPERIRLLRPGETASLSADGVVLTHSFLGRHARLTLQAFGQTIVLSTTDPHPPEPGSRIRVGWNHDDTQLLRGDSTDHSSRGTS